ncbi:hypothetical protein, partial [Stieleria sp.]|uniref:hypothetical protein n=1 Tax=Stieleria sp. TaxID=2795976 RepID=UPI0035663E58
CARLLDDGNDALSKPGWIWRDVVRWNANCIKSTQQKSTVYRPSDAHDETFPQRKHDCAISAKPSFQIHSIGCADSAALITSNPVGLVIASLIGHADSPSPPAPLPQTSLYSSQRFRLLKSFGAHDQSESTTRLVRGRGEPFWVSRFSF